MSKEKQEFYKELEKRLKVTWEAAVRVHLAAIEEYINRLNEPVAGEHEDIERITKSKTRAEEEIIRCARLLDQFIEERNR